MKHNELNPDESPFQYQSMSSLLAANYYKEKYEETGDKAFLEKYQQYEHRLDVYKQLEQRKLLLRLKKKVNRWMMLPIMVCSFCLTSVFTGFFQDEVEPEPPAQDEAALAPVLEKETPEVKEKLPKGYQSFPLKNETQTSTPVQQILHKQEEYANDSLEQAVYADLLQVFRSALYQYIKDNDGAFPSKITDLFGGLPYNYLSGIPRDPYFYSNQVTAAYDGTGGWVYNPALGKSLMAENVSLTEAIQRSLGCNGNCGEPDTDFSPIQITIVKNKHLLIVHTKNQIFAEYPIALGKAGTETPTGKFSIKRKLAYPRHDLEQATNPYGSRLLELSNDEYAIHGTPQEELLGKNVSKGCIRMKNADIIELYSYVSIGTQVRIVDHQSENPSLAAAKRAQKKEMKGLSPSPMLLSPQQIQDTKAMAVAGGNDNEDNKGDTEEPNAVHPSKQSNNGKTSIDRASFGKNSAGGSGGGFGSSVGEQTAAPKNMPSSLLPKTPNSNEISNETRKWKE